MDRNEIIALVAAVVEKALNDQVPNIIRSVQGGQDQQHQQKQQDLGAPSSQSSPAETSGSRQDLTPSGIERVGQSTNRLLETVGDALPIQGTSVELHPVDSIVKRQKTKAWKRMKKLGEEHRLNTIFTPSPTGKEKVLAEAA